MEKMIKFFLSLFCLIALCVVATSYIVELQLAAERSNSTKKNGNRYQLLFGTITHSESKHHPTESDLALVEKRIDPVCFKIDTVTGDVWLYVSEFYKDADRMTKVKGFQIIHEQPPSLIEYIEISDYIGISETTERGNKEQTEKKLKLILDDPSIKKTN